MRRAAGGGALALIACAALAACGGGAQTGAQAPAVIASPAGTTGAQSAGGSSLLLVANGGATPAALVFAPQTRFSIPGSAVVHVAISPAPAAAPPVTWSSSDDSIVTVSTGSPPPTSGVPPQTPPAGDALAVQGSARGAARITATVGAPYNVTVTQAVYSYRGINLGCGIGDVSVAQINDDGSYADGSRGFNDLGVQMTPPSPGPTPTPLGVPVPQCSGVTSPLVYTFTYGAVAVPIATLADFVAIRASAWRAAVRDSSTAPVVTGGGSIVWVGKTHDGAIYKFGPGLLDVAPPGGDFATVPIAASPAAGSLAGVTTVPTFTATLAEPAGNNLFAPVSGSQQPVIVGASSFGALIDPLFRPQVTLALAPSPYASPSVQWTTTGTITVTSSAAGGVTVGATAPGTGTLTATVVAPGTATVSTPVLAYPTLSAGCSDAGASSFGIVFANEHSIGQTGSPVGVDLYASFDPATATCGSGGATPAAAGWYFPYGGVVFPNGDDPGLTPPSGSPRGTTFDRVTSSMWRNDRTSEPYAAYLRDFFPCTAFSGGVGTPVANCTTMPDRILLIKAQNGRYVKLFWTGRGPGSFVGLYQVSAADGTFAY